MSNPLTLILEGRIDSNNAAAWEAKLMEAAKAAVDGNIELDARALEYISSAGLRVLLSAQKRMMKQGEMKVTHVNETIMEIFEVTGFSDILTIE
jgi:anti-sigma B factor antagonist